VTTQLQALSVAAALALTTAATGFAASDPSAARRELSDHQLADHQLDRIVAGDNAAATADGTGQAVGRTARSGASVTNFVRSDPAGVRGAAMGQASASATASPGSLAVASSTLSLSVTLP
jgi:hypothetical protein